jgi:uncharacterized protein (TIGR02270 family)
VSTPTKSAEPFHDLVEESLDEAAFLWTRWEADLSSLTRNLVEVWSWTEDRLGGAIDGIKVAPDDLLEQVTSRAFSLKDLAFHTVAAHVLATAPTAPARTQLASVLHEATGPSLAAMLRGIEVATLTGSFAPVAKALAKQDPEHCAGLVRVKSFQRAALGDELRAAYEDATPAQHVTVFRAVGHLPQAAATPWVETGLKHPSAGPRLAAIESGIRQRLKPAWHAALELLQKPEAVSAPLLRIVAMLGSAAEHRQVYAALSTPALQRACLWALGNLGTREAAEHCLVIMDEPTLARSAGEAYCAITGADLARARLTAHDTGEAPSLPPFEEDDLDADLVPRHEELWPLPDSKAVRQHWAGIASQFVPDHRYVRGEPADVNALVQAVETGPMLRRPDYLFELFVRTEGRYDVEARAMRAIQQHMMASGRARLERAADAYRMLQLENKTPFAATFAVLPDRDGIDTLYIVVKATANLRPTLSLADEQLPPVEADEYYGDPELTSLRAASDFHLGKPGTDVLLVGQAWAPNGRPVPESWVRVTVAERSRTLRVWGDRLWQRDGTPTAPEPFTSMPLVWERAYGGVHRDGEVVRAEERNPVGLGFLGTRKPEELAGQPAPNIDDPEQPFEKLGEQPRPICLAPIAPSWLPRRAYAGTYDGAWQRQRAPYLPQDFDLRFFQNADGPLAFDRFLQAGDPIEITGASADGPVAFDLPGVCPHIEAMIAGSAETPPVNLETLLIEPDENRASFTWRGSIPCDRKLHDVAKVVVTLPTLAGSR